MDDPLHHHLLFTSDRQQQQQQLQRATSSGLARYQSAPSSYFASLLDTSIDDLVKNCNEFVNPRPSIPQVGHVSDGFMPPGSLEESFPHGSVNEQPQFPFMATSMKSANDERQLQRQGSGFSSASQMINHNQCQPTMSNQSIPMSNPDTFTTSIKSASENYVGHGQHLQRQGSGFSSASQMILQNQTQPPTMPNQSLPMSNPATEGMYLPQTDIGGGRNTSLLRQSSSPANFFANFDIEGYGKGSNLEALNRSPNKLKRQLDFPSAMGSSSGIRTPVSETENKSLKMSGTGFPYSSWDDSDIFSDGFLKGYEDDERKTFSGMNTTENLNDEVGNSRPPTMLSHHLSLPKSSVIDKFLQLQDSVPCKTRAKRGCATHPRSIAERVRRTRISERMRKLQDLVPNMDKQTNTSDMLDLAVDYIKDLQTQLETLSDNRVKCNCSHEQT